METLIPVPDCRRQPQGLHRRSNAYEGIGPSAAGSFPLVVVSPGWGGRYFALFFYAERLASHGFVVAVTQHYRDGALAWDARDALDVAMLNRPRDVSFMLDAVLERNADAAHRLPINTVWAAE